MSFNYISIPHDKNLFKDGYNTSSYNSFLKNIKEDKLFLSKIIYEKNPVELFNKQKSLLYIDHNRYISQYNDKLLLFNTGEQTDIVLLWYSEYGIKKHISIYNGKAIIIDLYSSLYHNISIQDNETLYSSILCDFQYFDVQYFLKKYSGQSFDLNSKYVVL